MLLIRYEPVRSLERHLASFPSCADVHVAARADEQPIQPMDARLVLTLALHSTRRPHGQSVVDELHVARHDPLAGMVHLPPIVCVLTSGLDLWRTLRAAVIESKLHTLAERLRENGRTPTLLLQALVAVVRRSPPARSVLELARMLHCDASTLYHHWRFHMGDADRPGTAQSIRQLVDMVLLLRALAVKRRAYSWAEVAGKLRLQPRRLSAVARRTRGAALGYLDTFDGLRLLWRAEEMLIPALRSDPSGPDGRLERAERLPYVPLLHGEGERVVRS